MKDQAQPKLGPEQRLQEGGSRNMGTGKEGPRKRTTANGRPSDRHARPQARPATSPTPPDRDTHRPATGRERRDPLAYRPIRVVEGGASSRPARPLRPPQPGNAAHSAHIAARRHNRRRIPPVVVWNRRFLALRNLLAATFVLECAWLALTSPLLVVRQVRVVGASIRAPKEIAQVAGLTKLVNIFRAPTGRAERRLAALPEVSSVRVERRLPRALAVVVVERRAAASVLTKGGCWIIDPSGFVFRKVGAPLPDRPVLLAPPTAPVALGRTLPITALPAALRCLAQLPGLPLAHNVRLHVDASQEAWLNNPDGFKIRLGPLDDAPDRLALTGRILNGPDGREILANSLVLDVTTPNSEVRIPRSKADPSRPAQNS